jgi:coproporphyrinogen III oxidase
MPLNKTLAQHMRQRGKSYENEENLLVYANGVSLVIHPISPFIPTVHANYRYFEIQDKTTGKTLDFWFGGGADLTPHYLFEEDCVLFHQEHKKACDSTKDLTLYPKLKKICDEYFYLPHRKEHRGIGGVFYDDFLIENDWYKTFRFSSFCATAVLNAYKEILNRRKDLKWTEENMHWKEIRRGRYAEFNLIIDRGTKFGLFTPDARIESILMSLPLVARWEYMHQVEKGSEEEKMMEVIKNARNWI